MTRRGGASRAGFPRRWPSPPIAVQVMALLLAGLVVAQTVTLVLTVLLPPAPAMHHTLADIAAGLRGAVPDGDADRPLVRTVETQPPSLQSPGWVASEPASADLARLLNAPREDVRLLFYAPPPFAGAESRRPGRSAAGPAVHHLCRGPDPAAGPRSGRRGRTARGMGPMGGVQVRQGFPARRGDARRRRPARLPAAATAAGRPADLQLLVVRAPTPAARPTRCSPRRSVRGR
jgi:two-component system OmpR family sensor kinase